MNKSVWVVFTHTAVAMAQSCNLPISKSDRRDSLDLDLLYLLEKEPGLSQRELADRLGISLGKVNYCLKSLLALGAIKFGNFRASSHKMRYAYMLTPAGLSRKANLTRAFLRHKMEEYERLKAQIAALEDDLAKSDAGGQASL
ncbi:MarR family EPS-associated transcriptional regulator [Caenibius tardaugens]|nr:MarR family EPS-associated transcriptional regulator [Caenibius tardaugens]